MTKARDLANLISTGNALSDGAISVSEISDLTASAAELNKLDGVTATTAELNHLVGATSSVQTQLDNISVTSGSLTKTFTQNETADITLSQSITSAPVVSATKEVPQAGISTKGNWDVNSTASNYDFHDTATNVTLTPSVGVNSQVTSLTYASKTGHVNGSDSQAIALKSDGLKIFSSGSSGYIYEHSLGTAWDLSTISTLRNFNHTGYMSNVRGMYWKPDGTKFYIVGNNDTAFEFDLSTAWNLNSVSYNSKNININSQHGTGSQGIFFKPDGTKMFIVDYTNHHIGEWALSTAWDISTASHTRNAGVVNTPKDIVFNSDGTVIYIVTATKITEYNCSTPYDLSTMSTPNRDFTTSESTNNQGLTIRPNDEEIFIINASDDAYEYNFPQVNTLVLGSGSFSASDVGKRIVGNGGDVVLTSTGGAYSTTGGSAFTDNSTIAAGSWQMFGLKSAGDADGITMSGFAQTGNTFNTTAPLIGTSQNNYPNLNNYVGFVVSQNGLHAYGARQSNGQIHHYTMSTAFDVTTLSLASDTLATGYTQSAGDVHISADGTKVYATNNNYPYSGDHIKQWTLSTPYDLSTAGSGTEITVNGGGQAAATSNGSGGQLDFSPDGTKLYYSPYAHWTGNTTHGHSHPTNTVSTYSSSGLVFQYTLSTAYDVTGTINYDGAVRVPMKGNNYASMCVTSDGKFLIQTIYNAEHMFIYPLTTNFDITTATHTTEQYHSTASQNSSGSSSQGGISICHVDGKLFNYSYGLSRVDVNAYGTASVITLPTSQYHVAVTNNGGRIDSQYFTDINSMTAAENAGTGTAHYAVSTDGRTTWSVAKGTDGVRPIVQNNSGTWQYNNDGGNTTINSNISSATYSNSSFSYGNQTGSALGVTFKPDGTRMYVTSQHYTYQYNLSTPFDLSTATYSNYNVGLHSYDSTVESFFIKPDGTKAWFVGRTNDQVRLINLSTAWELNTATVSSDTFSVSGAEGNPTGLWFKPDGTKMYFVGTSNDAVWEYSLSTAWDVTTASYTTNISVAAQDGAPSGLAFNSTGTKMYVTGELNVSVFEYNLSTAWDVSTATYSNYSLAVNSNGSNLQSVFIGNNDEKIYVILQSNNSVYEYSNASNAYTTTATWVNGTVNDELYTLQQALGAQSHNRMDKTQLDAVADANHFTLGNSLDLMIALRMDTAAATLPTSDGVTLNYDAAALNEGAVLGTDYDFFFPANNKVQIKSLAAQNLKVRVV